MAVSHCPGQNRRYWKPEDIVSVTCPACGREVELFKDEGRRKCPGCGVRLTNPRVAESCASWCSFAEDCLGVSFGESRRREEKKSSAAGREDPSEKLITLLSEEFNLSKNELITLFKVSQTVRECSSLRGLDPVFVKIYSVLAVFMRLRERPAETESAGLSGPLLQELSQKLPEILDVCGVPDETAEEIITRLDRKKSGPIETVVAEVLEKAGVST